MVYILLNCACMQDCGKPGPKATPWRKNTIFIVRTRAWIDRDLNNLWCGELWLSRQLCERIMRPLKEKVKKV